VVLAFFSIVLSNAHKIYHILVAPISYHAFLDSLLSDLLEELQQPAATPTTPSTPFCQGQHQKGIKENSQWLVGVHVPFKVNRNTSCYCVVCCNVCPVTKCSCSVFICVNKAESGCLTPSDTVTSCWYQHHYSNNSWFVFLPLPFLLCSSSYSFCSFSLLTLSIEFHFLVSVFQ
jgi:hypothetical protein